MKKDRTIKKGQKELRREKEAEGGGRRRRGVKGREPGVSRWGAKNRGEDERD